MPVEDDIANLALLFVKYRLVLPSVRSSVVELPEIKPAVALSIPESVPNVKAANDGDEVVAIL